MLKHFRRVGKAVVGSGPLCKLCWPVLPGAFALAAALIPAAPAGRGGAPKAHDKAPAKRLSLAEFVKSEKRLASFRKGVKKMRELPSTDPRSWAFQANIHWRPHFPVFVYEQAAKSGDPARQLFRDDPGFTPDPNVFSQCPHGNWWFLPWHRAYLHYFERILRWAADDPQLALPYWDYADPGQRELPPAFRERTVKGRDNPLYLPESVTFQGPGGKPEVFLLRDGPLLRGETQLSGSITRLDALALVPFSNARPAPANLSFGGPQACDGACVCGFGALEAAPHNRVHTAIGGSSAQAGGSVRIGFMGDSTTAARDPVFWVHHCNIDRIWASWAKLGHGRKHPEDPEWLQRPFTFFNVDGKGNARPVTITVQELLKTEPLGYVYDRLEPLPDKLVARAPFAAPAPGEQSIQPLAATAPAGRPAPHPPKAGAGGIRLGTARHTVVTVPLAEGVKPQAVRDLLAPAPAARPGGAVLSLEGIELDQLPGVDYEVYLNLPEKAEPTPGSPHYLGALTFFGAGRHAGARGHGGPRAPQYARFALPEALRKALAARPEALKDLRVTFVPQTGTEPVRPGARVLGPVERPAVSIRQVRLLYVR
jgi:tyrosinase